MKIYFLFFFIYSQCLFSQTLNIEYDYIYNWDLLGENKFKSKLKISEDKSTFSVNFNNNYDFDDNSLNVKTKGDYSFYKDYLIDSIYYTNTIIFKNFPTKDPIKIFKWKLENESKNILGYKCQKATTQHFGRSYSAYFTTELGFNHGGPWKFDGLPGVILEIKSSDGEFSIIANSIELIKGNTEINNPFREKDYFINFDEYKRLYNLKYKENNKTTLNANGSTTTQSFPKCKIECLVD